MRLVVPEHGDVDFGDGSVRFVAASWALLSALSHLRGDSPWISGFGRQSEKWKIM